MLTENPENLILKAANNWSIEITPNASKKIEDFSTILEKNTTVNVTFLPNTDISETIETSKKLFESGMNPVPHVSARAIRDVKELDYFIKNLSETCNVTEVLVIAGSGKKPVGDFHETMQILETGVLQNYNIKKIGVAGHPEGSPDIENDVILDSLKRKYEWSKKNKIPIYIETQFLFDAEIVLSWEKFVRENGINVPIRVGIPGPATIKTLFQFAQSSGVGASMRIIAKQAKNISKLFFVQAPDKFIFDLSKGIHNNRNCLIDNLHFYPFGGFKKTAEWAKALERGNFTLNSNGGFSIHES